MPGPAPRWGIERDGDQAVLRLSGDWLARETALRQESELQEIAATSRTVARLRVDTFSAVGRWDSALVAFVARLDALASGGATPAQLDLAALPDPLRRLLALARGDRAAPPNDAQAHRPSLLEAAGTLAVAGWKKLAALAELVGIAVLGIGPAATGRLRARAVDVLALMQDCGIGALGIAAIVNGLVGAILGFVGAAQLRRFGAELYVTDLVGVGVVREMAPIMTAIVMAGRTGGAYAAQIATMQGSEEIDALRALGIPVSQFVVIPRILAAVTMVPILALYGCFMGLFGGFVVSVVMLHLSPAIFLSHLRSAVPWTEFAIGLTKSVCFGAVIAIAGCRTGLDAGRSAADVGHAATSAVVDGIIGVIALDAIFAACAEVLGI